MAKIYFFSVRKYILDAAKHERLEGYRLFRKKTFILKYANLSTTFVFDAISKRSTHMLLNRF